jgi:thioesterase domain-containing protein
VNTDRPSLLPRDLVELELTQLWEPCLGVEPIGVRDDFFALGGDERRAIALLDAVTTRFAVVVPLRRFLETPTVEQLGVLLRESTRLTPASCAVAIQPAGASPPFFCAPPTGGTSIHYRSLARALGNDQPFYGLQQPGLEGEREPFTDWTQLASHYVDAIRRIQPSGPYFLGGWSDGGRVALEIAQQIFRQGGEVRLLAIFDEQIEPQPPGVERTTTDDVELLAAMIGHRLPIDLEALRRMAFDERLQYALNLAKAASLLPPDYGLVHARRQFAVFKANAIARSAYRSVRYPGRVAVFWAGDGIRDETDDRSARWRAIAGGGLETYVVPGTHLTMMARAHVEPLARDLRACLARAHALV